jgi:protein-L-isoaspartate(D-aspartate) O-methyltransferase
MGKRCRLGFLGAAARGLCAAVLFASVLASANAQEGEQNGEIDYARARAAMVQMIQLEAVRLSAITGVEQIDARILEVMAEVPRHDFVPKPLRRFAYGAGPLPVGHDQNLAAPFLVALMTQLIDPQPGDVVFETGTGAGYHAAVLARLVDHVYSVEVIEPLAMSATATLRRLGYDRVSAKAGDGYYGWPAKAPFDAIILKEAVDYVPTPLLDQLKPGGRMVLPLGSPVNGQYLTLIEKAADGSITKRRILPVTFSALQGGERT